MAQSTKLTHKDVKEMVKHDVFREKTLETVEYVSGHRSQILKYVAAGVAALVLVFGIWFYRDGQHTTRMNALNDAFKMYNAQVVEQGNPPPFANYFYRSVPEKEKASQKAFTDITEKYSGSDEASIARFYLGVIAGDAGKADEAEKQFKVVADTASRDYASLAKLSLAQVYRGKGRLEEGRKLVQSLIDSPTTFVTKDQATIEMARLIMQEKPAEARKLLDPLKTSVRAAISQAAIGILGELQQQQQK